MKHYIGIDLGGTFIKAGLVADSGEIVKFATVPTRVADGADTVLSDIESLINGLISGLDGKIEGIGIGVPGLVDGEKRNVVYATNLGWKNVPVAEQFERAFSCPVRLCNDADAAGLGEAKFGAGGKFSSSIFLTLGTGVGGAIIIDGKLYSGNQSAGGEIGHMLLKKGGRKCNCGNRGCYERYASATALVADAVAAMKKDPSSRMWEVGDISKVCGKTAFDFYDLDATAKLVVDKYLDNLTAGIVSLCNVLRPQAVVLGGGIAKQGRFLTDKVQERLDKLIFAADVTPRVTVLTASLKEAGVIGAASLNM